MQDAELNMLAEAVLARCRAQNRMVVTAESCTGGMVAAALTAIAGSSDVLDRGFVTYSNAAKTELLQVPSALIESVGAVSLDVAAEMAEGAIRNSRASLAVAITGIAGPGGGSPEKPVGLVCFGLARRNATPQTERHVFSGNRAAIRLAATRRALELLLSA